MGEMVLYRQRLIPAEKIKLENDIVVHKNDEYIVTKWETLKKRGDFSHGCSIYDMGCNVKISKFFDENNELKYYYCDIVDIAVTDNEYVVLDLLADVIVNPDLQNYKVVDLDEFGEALKLGLINSSMVGIGLERLDNLLKMIYNGEFEKYIKIFEEYNL